MLANRTLLEQYTRCLVVRCLQPASGSASGGKQEVLVWDSETLERHHTLNLAAEAAFQQR